MNDYPDVPPRLRPGPLAAFGLILLTIVGTPAGAVGQGRCVRAAGTPACNADPITPVFAPTGWRTTTLDHIAFRVADPQKEAAFYAALMGWTLRSDDGTLVVMDIGDWGTALFRRAPRESSGVPAAGRGAAAGTARARVDGLGFDIEPWNATAVEAALRARGLLPAPGNDGAGFESFHVQDPDGFDLQIGNGHGHTKVRQGPSSAARAAAAPFTPTGWRTVWLDHLSFGVTNYKASASFYANLLGWLPTYDEGSQHELRMANIGDIIIRGGNPFDPAFRRQPRQGARIDHLSFGIAPWDSEAVERALRARGLTARVDTADGSAIRAARYKSYHTTTPNGYDLQISDVTRDTRTTLADVVRPETRSHR